MTTKPMTVVFGKVVELADVLGVESINDYPGCWEYRISDKWLLKLNGHPEEVDGIPPFHAYVEFNGWPTGVFNPWGGEIAAGEAANEDILIEALDEAIRTAKERTT